MQQLTRLPHPLHRTLIQRTIQAVAVHARTKLVDIPHRIDVFAKMTDYLLGCQERTLWMRDADFDVAHTNDMIFVDWHSEPAAPLVRLARHTQLVLAVLNNLGGDIAEHDREPVASHTARGRCSNQQRHLPTGTQQLGDLGRREPVVFLEARHGTEHWYMQLVDYHVSHFVGKTIDASPVGEDMTNTTYLDEFLQNIPII